MCTFDFILSYLIILSRDTRAAYQLDLSFLYLSFRITLTPSSLPSLKERKQLYNVFKNKYNDYRILEADNIFVMIRKIVLFTST